MLTKLEEETWFYILEKDEETNEYFLDVVCGTVGLYEIKIKLTEKEVADYIRDPSHVRMLANAISSNPSQYLDRKIT